MSGAAANESPEVRVRDVDAPGVWWFGDDGPAIGMPGPPRGANPMYPFARGDWETPFRHCGWARLRRVKAGASASGQRDGRALWSFDLARVATGTTGRILDWCDAQQRTGTACATRLAYFWGGAWAREDFAHPATAAHRLIDLLRWRDVPRVGSAAIPFPPPPATDPHTSRTTTATDDLAAAWQQRPHRRGVPELAAIGAALARPDRMSVFAIDPVTGQDDARFVGAQSPLATVFGRAWAKSPDRLPDDRYQTAVQSPYATVRDSGEPFADRVIAAIQTIHAPEPLWVPYQRLLCPLDGPGAPVICATSILPGSASPIP
jgi:hypothetical protein